MTAEKLPVMGCSKRVIIGGGQHVASCRLLSTLGLSQHHSLDGHAKIYFSDGGLDRPYFHARTAVTVLLKC
jgi:hypothetical protein